MKVTIPDSNGVSGYDAKAVCMRGSCRSQLQRWLPSDARSLATAQNKLVSTRHTFLPLKAKHRQPNPKKIRITAY